MLLQQQAHCRGALQGDEIFGQQFVPGDLCFLRQSRADGHHRNEAVHVQRLEQQRVAGLGFEAHPQFDAAVAHQFQHLLVDHVVHRHVDPWVAAAEHLQRPGQQVAGKGRHGGDGDLAQLQGEALAQQLLGVVPVGQQLPGQGQQGFTFGGEGYTACCTAE
ncbi:hypothetical protein D9M73_188210 [compost metagenome]